jgi:NO-binding membrane sensor protein with MHYT domain
MSVAIFPMMAAMPGMSGTSVTSFDPTLVALSFVISVFGSLTGLQSAQRARHRSGRASFGWLVAAALSIGGGAIWSMHFIGMLAYQNDVSYSFNVTRTLLSLLVAVLASGAGLYIASRGQATVLRYLGAGTITGVAVAGMHYLGMSAMEMNASLTFRLPIVVLSVAIAIVAATIALFFAFTVTGLWATIAAALVMGVGVCGMHYTGMAAAIITPHLDIGAVATVGVNPLSLALPIFGIASVLLFILLFVGLFEDVDREDVLPVPAPAMG